LSFKPVGAEIKCITKEPISKMQHKFCLVDDDVLMTGTLNWGNDRSSDHWNYVYITNKLQLVAPVKKGFYEMWNDFTCEIESSTDNTQNESNTTTDITEDCEFVQPKEKEAYRTKSPTPELYLV
jgi:hypothetical protein